ncbi:YhdB family protein [Amphibacillus sp. MSJ-3]|uniref:YhdB family protein n=1 Tax=Amphibacillus sp. MSJ-3 TaxID=2841505 RepID=UPI001C0F362D|nr:YhdB family protein [Amphibacillus sp. MSJ-3]MBU5595672.1 YhdB family protein [Amphibacillus sp. MSJ-3]
MATLDYDKALYYTLWQQWDDLIVIMVRTKDDLLAKKINNFLCAFRSENNTKIIIQQHENLLHYLDHAMGI